MFPAVDDDRRDLLVEEDEDGGEQGRNDADYYQPPRVDFHRIDEPTSETNKNTLMTLKDHDDVTSGHLVS